MACGIAQCRLRVEPASLIKEVQTSTENKAVFEQPHIAALDQQHQLLLILNNYEEIPFDTRLKWITAITELFLGPSEPKLGGGVRDFDLVLKSNGSIENLAETTTSTRNSEGDQLREYPAWYQIPRPILENLDCIEEKIKRTELFALGCILYELISGHGLCTDLGDKENGNSIQRKYKEGLFPDEVWGLDKAVRILACWCPAFAKQLLERRSARIFRFHERKLIHCVSGSFLPKLTNYIKQHPIKFGLQVAGGVASLASLAVSPILGLVGFAATGPIASSAAAGWQASIGLVRAGSLFSWCQSAAMGGAAATGVLVIGLTGAGVALSATVSGALDIMGDGDALPDLKEMFLEAWKRDVEGKVKEKEKL
jgi:hypothetical protein